MVDTNQGIKYEKGLCVSFTSELTYNLDRKYTYFKCIIGHHDYYPEYKGLLVFRVFVDGGKIYESRQMGAGDSEEVNVTVRDTNHRKGDEGDGARRKNTVNYGLV